MSVLITKRTMRRKTRMLTIKMRKVTWQPPLLTLTKMRSGRTVGGIMEGSTVGNIITEITLGGQMEEDALSHCNV